jgi:hypothetical protein
MSDTSTNPIGTTAVPPTPASPAQDVSANNLASAAIAPPAPSPASNKPEAETKAGASVPAPAVNNPAVPSQKMAAIADLNKTSDAPHHAWINTAAEALAGGPRYRTSYDTEGNVTRNKIPVSTAHLSLAIGLEALRGGLAGLAAKGPNRMGEAAQAGMQTGQQQLAQKQAAQTAQDAQAREDQSRKLDVFKANMTNYQTAMLVGKESKEIADKLGDSTDFFTSGIQDGTIPLGDGMSHSEAIEADTMANLKNQKSSATKDFMLPYGPAIPVMENGVQKTVNGQPAWSHMYMTIHGAANGKMPLSPEMQKAFVDHGLMKNIPAAGIDANNWNFSDIANKLSAMQSIDTGERLLQDHKNDATEVLGHPGHGGPDGKGVEDLDDLAGKIKSDPQMRKAVQIFAAAQAGSKTDSKTGSKTGNIEDIIDAMRSRDLNAASIIMQHLGLNQNDLNEMRNKRRESETEATTKTPQGAAIDAQKRQDLLMRDPVTTANADSIIAAYKKPVAGQDIPKERYEQAVAFNQQVATQSGLKAGSEALEKAKADANEPEMQQLAKNIVSGDISKIGDVTTYRKDQRAALALALHNEAVAQGKDPNDWSAAMLITKADMIKDYREGKTSNNIQAFDAFLGHSDDAMDANDNWRRTGSRLINVPLNEFTKQMRNDPNYISFVTSLEPVRKEFMSFLNANRAEHEADIKIMQTVLDDAQTPANIEAALKQLGKSANIRLRTIGTKYQNTMHQPFPNLVSEDGKKALQHMGIGQANANVVPAHKVPAHDAQGKVVGYADDNKGTNYHAF